MPAYAWAALGVSLLATGAGIGVAVRDGLRAWRAFRDVRRAVGEGILDVLHGVTRAERRAARLGESATRVMQARDQLEESLAAARVMAAAAGDARSLLRVLGFLRR